MSRKKSKKIRKTHEQDQEIRNTIKEILDKNSTKLELKWLPTNLPQKTAIKLLVTIPQTEPNIKGSLACGYSKPRLREAKKVLSPSSPTKIQRATIKTQFNCKLENICKMLDLVELDLLLQQEVEDFLGKKPIMPNRIKEA